MKSLARHRRSPFRPLLLLCAAALPLLAAASARAGNPGDEDTSFTVGPTADGSVLAVKYEAATDQVLAGGTFQTFRGVSRTALARLNADGSTDTFTPGLNISAYNGGTATVDAIDIDPAGNILAAGIFNVLGQTPGGGVARFDALGNLDTHFDVGSGVLDAGGTVGQAYAIVALTDGSNKILVGGSFLDFDGVGSAGIVRLNSDGSVDGTFNPGGAGVSYPDSAPDVRAIAVQSDGKILVGGTFTAYNGVTTSRDIIRLNADGTLDTTFASGTGADAGSVEAVTLEGSQVLVGGNFISFDGATVPSIVRLSSVGALDTSFDPVNTVNIDEVTSIIAQPDGTILVGGVVYTPDGLIYNPGDGLALIHSDGTLSTSFDYGSADLKVTALALRPDGEVFIAGDNNGLTGGAVGDVVLVYDLTISSTPTVTITPGVAKTNEDGSSGPGTFVVNLSVAPSKKTFVYYKVKGGAIPGFDYASLSGKVKIKPGHTSATIKVVPFDEGINDGSVVAVKLVLQSPTDGSYTVGSPASAKVKILDNDDD